jgi:HAD superfamily hydrolase (TIGR01509 family)
MPLQALLWDVDGTLAESERDGHRVAFNRAFEDAGLPWRWDEAHYGALLRITGGRERLLHDMAARADAPTLADERLALAAQLHQRKNAHYADIVAAGQIPLREGVLALIEEAAAAGLKQGIATTTSRTNLQALLQRHLGPRGPAVFSVTVCGEDVGAKKPDPEVYQRALADLGVSFVDALALEDSPGGVAAARAARVPVIVTRSAYFADDTIDAAIAIGPGLHTRRGWRPTAAAAGDGPVRLDDLRDWHARMEWVSHHG